MLRELNAEGTSEARKKEIDTIIEAKYSKERDALEKKRLRRKK